MLFESEDFIFETVP